MTDFRTTDQQPPDEPVSSDSDQELAAPRRDATAGLAETAIRHSSEAAPPRAEAAHTPVSKPAGVRSVAQVADFIASSPLQHDRSPRSRRALAALERLDAEEGGEPTDKRIPPLPPELPPDAGIPELPSMMLGPAISTRGEVTERMSAMPITHPLANSIAPGGSRVSARPAPPRTAARWQAALGAAALLLLGAGASHYLQSRGEHHAAAAAARSEDAEEAEAREPDLPERAPEPVVPQEPLAVQEPQPEQAASRTDSVATSAAALNAPILTPDPPGSAAAQLTSAAQTEFAPSAPGEGAGSAARREVSARDRELRVAMGSVQLRKRRGHAGAEALAAELPLQPAREQVVATMNGVLELLRACVNGAHGVADVTLTVRSSGAVSHALVEGPFAESTRGSCIARTLRGVQLPPFRAPVVRIAYPLEL